MSFIKNLKSSIYSPEFYKKIKSQSITSGLKYYFLLAIILALIGTLFFSYELTIKIPKTIKTFVDEAVKAIPDNLEININNGQVSSTTSEPFFIPFPASKEFNMRNENNILVIDTKTPFSSTQFNQYNTLFWLTKDSLFYQNRDLEKRSLDLSKIKDFKINRNIVQNWVEKINPYFNWIGPGLIVLTFIGLYIGLMFKLVYFFFLAILIFFLSSIFRWGLNYSASYKTAIYSSTLSLFLDLVILNTGQYTNFYGFPFFFTLTALCITTINLQNFDKRD